MKYDLEFDEGGEAQSEGFPDTFNPYPWHSPQWYAWGAGWDRAKRLSEHDAGPVLQYEEGRI